MEPLTEGACKRRRELICETLHPGVLVYSCTCEGSTEMYDTRARSISSSSCSRLATPERQKEITPETSRDTGGRGGGGLGCGGGGL